MSMFACIKALRPGRMLQLHIIIAIIITIIIVIIIIIIILNILYESRCNLVPFLMAFDISIIGEM